MIFEWLPELKNSLTASQIFSDFIRNDFQNDTKVISQVSP